jgi:hypothetical protein
MVIIKTVMDAVKIVKLRKDSLVMHFPLIRMSLSWHFVHSLLEGPVHSAQLVSHLPHSGLLVTRSIYRNSPRKHFLLTV